MRIIAEKFKLESLNPGDMVILSNNTVHLCVSNDGNGGITSLVLFSCSNDDDNQIILRELAGHVFDVVTVEACET